MSLPVTDFTENDYFATEMTRGSIFENFVFVSTLQTETNVMKQKL
jgi:hypothetical protein